MFGVFFLLHQTFYLGILLMLILFQEFCYGVNQSQPLSKKNFKSLKEPLLADVGFNSYFRQSSLIFATIHSRSFFKLP